jgi:hypothetical protein
VAFCDFWASGSLFIFCPDFGQSLLVNNVTFVCLFSVINFVALLIPVEKVLSSQIASTPAPRPPPPAPFPPILHSQTPAGLVHSGTNRVF